ncbi:hypothetical protein SteCoe_14492 [Stentor coeruleus]|uniref:ER membrane protein complex subunit 6 n=1 Tax=Stentor coeruleus TaxID=5963 RepID=A0A1R2C5X7_9CILI|nr:hypothetical protein SteCoe_14492 [Stentor coeruleus]
MASVRSTGFSSEQTSEKDAIMDNLYWIKQIISIILGCVAGGMNLTGFPIIICFGIAVSSFSLVYAWQIMKAEEIESWDLVTEAFGPSFFCFILVWTLTFTFL